MTRDTHVDSRDYARLPESERDRIANEWGDRIYFCVECDEACRETSQYHQCSSYPREHDRSGYIGTGTDYPPKMRRLARKIAKD